MDQIIDSISYEDSKKDIFLDCTRQRCGTLWGNKTEKKGWQTGYSTSILYWSAR